MWTIRAAIKWGIAVGLLLGMALCLLAFVSRIPLSRMAAYDRLRVGMTRDEAVQVLRSSQIECGLTEPGSDAPSCRFSDPWRFYAVWVDAKARRVSRKRVSMRKPVSFIDLLKFSH